MKARKFLRRSEVDQLLTNATSGRYGKRDRLLLLMMFKHGFRASEVIDLRWTDIDFTDKTILCRRLKRGVDSVHPLSDDEQSQLLELYTKSHGATHVFLSERGGKLTRSSVNKIVERASVGLSLHVHPHMVRHSTGYALANGNVAFRTIMDFMGHRSASSTVVYTALAAERFREASTALG